ncbi:putative GPI-anchored protein pfl2 isoform X2 [Carassius auratus]|uniref:GPI-anchored protein pfl2 isoform X2 n=1 Tax=Carassius auratus TaxID=7957 RepID=A0A6P6KYU4_CARAU|nr:putative GPI-anchored protein pfl2 isoform X2 [Carassius auratus]
MCYFLNHSLCESRLFSSLTLAVMELFIFIVFQLLTEVQSYNALQKPFISVNNDEQLNIACEIPLSVRADSICSLYTKDDVLLFHRVSHWSQSGGNLCIFYLSRSELFTQSVNSRELSCVYSLKTEPENRSPHSDTITISNTIPITVTVTIRDTINFRDTITTRDSTSTTTEHTTTTTAPTSFQSKTSLPTSTAKEKLNVISTSEITTYSKTEVQSKTSLPTSTAKTTLTVLTVMSTSEKTTYSKADDQSKTSLPTSKSKTTLSSVENSTLEPVWFIVLVSSGAAVIVSGLICFCRFASKKRRKLSMKPDVSSQGIGMSCSGPAETYFMITSVPATSQPISEGLKHPESHQDSTADPKDSYSFITSVNTIYQPSDVLVNKQQKQGNPENKEVCVNTVTPQKHITLHHEQNTNTFISCMSLRMFITCTPQSLTNQFSPKQKITCTVWCR